MSISDSIRIAAGLVLTAIEYIVGQIGTMKEKNIMTACLAVIQYNGEWGFRTLERLHYSIYSQSWWDLVPTVTYYLINKNGVTGQVWPYGPAAVINGWAAANMAYFYSTFIGVFGNGN
ncbi:MAG: hypothetical protein ACUVXA_16850 [Candidatus Jordarchaeum sp.]|uniref:hypothetical protein n=1 Tax=Candidatus Jordarchaeum sp. TaxID=2823881 RepID=UPI00404A7150